MGVPYAPNIREWPYLCNRSSDLLHVWFYVGVFGDGGSNGAISGSKNPRWRPPPSLDKFQMAISPQPVVRSTPCLVLGWGFRGRRIEWRYFRFEQIQDGGSRHLGKISNGHISATGRPIHFMFGYRVGFSGTADLMALFSIRTNPRWRPPPSWIILNGHISATAHDLLI